MSLKISRFLELLKLPKLRSTYQFRHESSQPRLGFMFAKYFLDLLNLCKKDLHLELQVLYKTCRRHTGIKIGLSTAEG